MTTSSNRACPCFPVTIAGLAWLDVSRPLSFNVTLSFGAMFGVESQPETAVSSGVGAGGSHVNSVIHRLSSIRKGDNNTTSTARRTGSARLPDWIR